MARNNVEKISRRRWYATGGFSNPHYFRKHNGCCWEYLIDWSL